MLSSTILGLLRNPETPDYILRDAVLEETETVANVYVVCGSCGKYSDRRGWTVAAFLEQNQAIAFCDKINQWCIEHYCHSNNFDSEKAEEKLGVENLWEQDKFSCPLDPKFQLDYTGTSYGIDTVLLRAEG